MMSIRKKMCGRLLGMALGFLAAGLIQLWQPAAAAPETAAASDFIENIGHDVLGVLRAGKSDQKRHDQLIALLNESIDLDLVGRLTLGKNWRSANDAQRHDYMELFRAYALETLATSLSAYNGQDFIVSGAKPTGKSDILVQTQVVEDGRRPLSVDWRLRPQKDGQLAAIDVIIEGVSMVVTQRAEFAAVVERDGMDGLLESLRKRRESSVSARSAD